MEDYLIKFIEWTKLKIRIHIKPEDKIYFHEREVWWASLGANIGFEQDGKNIKFERPILILRKFGGEMLWALPMTTKEKTGRFYYQFEHKGQKYSVILSQLRLISSKRLLRKIRTFPEDDFKKVRNRIRRLL
ncbi:type II toxin-antitoxin system PemK/MazF family toxin [Patescibacteria group bacterium]|nr:type II toxin-antitoxin system PemK/MazF family toxin [Patescibacteria group bacterium]